MSPTLRWSGDAHVLPGFSRPHLRGWLLCGMSGEPRPSLASVLCRSLRDDCAGASPSVVGTRADFKITLGPIGAGGCLVRG